MSKKIYTESQVRSLGVFDKQSLSNDGIEISSLKNPENIVMLPNGMFLLISNEWKNNKILNTLVKKDNSFSFLALKLF